jgi:hypothetical protein
MLAHTFHKVDGSGDGGEMLGMNFRVDVYKLED